nr:MAG TPA: hypothetical protein [Caudoviricetes sp.]DAP99739.1 MAG TPA: hypothetical protein [Caudoviricetes sp.]
MNCLLTKLIYHNILYFSININTKYGKTEEV